MLRTEPPPPQTDTPVRRPAVSDPTYPSFIRHAPRGSLTPESLAADYRAAVAGGHTRARDAAASRLFAGEAEVEKDEGFLRPIHREARRIANVRRDLPPSAFVGMILDEILDTLPTSRGDHAEKDWTAFCHQRGLDVNERELAQKRRAHVHDDRDVERFVSDEALPDADAEDMATAFEVDFVDALWLAVNSIIDTLPDPSMQLIARDQLGPDPSKVSGTKWRETNGRPPLLDQLGWEQTETNRSRVYDLRKRARTIIRAELYKAIEAGDLPMDPLFLRDFLPDTRS